MSSLCKKIILLSVLFMTNVAYANIAKVVALQGEVSIIRDGKTFFVTRESNIKKQDQIETKKNSKLQLLFKDQTIISIGNNSVFKVNEYLFDEKNKNVKAEFSMFKGIFRTITGKIGKIAPKKFILKTKTASIGIRGTQIVMNIQQNKEDIFCTEGKIYVTSFKTKRGITVSAGKFVSINPANIKLKVKKIRNNDLYKINKSVSFSSNILIDDVSVNKSNIGKSIKGTKSTKNIKINKVNTQKLNTLNTNKAKTNTLNTNKAQEKANKEKANKEKANKEKANKEKANKEKANKEKANKEKANKEKANKEKANKEKANKEKANKEKANKEKAKEEKAKEEKANKEKAKEEKAKEEKAKEEKAKEEKAKEEKAKEEKTDTPDTPDTDTPDTDTPDTDIKTLPDYFNYNDAKKTYKGNFNGTAYNKDSQYIDVDGSKLTIPKGTTIEMLIDLGAKANEISKGKIKLGGYDKDALNFKGSVNRNNSNIDIEGEKGTTGVGSGTFYGKEANKIKGRVDLSKKDFIKSNSDTHNDTGNINLKGQFEADKK